jgi:dCMP deaminase
MGSSIEGGTLYCTTQPCVICTKMIINAGIKRVVITESYPDELAESMAKEAGLVIEVLDAGKERAPAAEASAGRVS